MGYGLMPKFEDEGGVYDRKACKHGDCEEVRKERASICPYCKKGFVADDRFYYNDNKEPIHAICAWEEAKL